MFGVEVRQMGLLDVRGAVALQRICFPAPFPEELLWSAAHLERHIELFPDGQFVVVAASDVNLGNPKKKGVLASASSLIISEAKWLAHSDWEATCGGHFFENHEPMGSTLFGADISVHPGWRGRGLGKSLYETRFRLVKELGLARFGTACRIPDFKAWQWEDPNSTPADYCELVSSGKVADRTLTPLLKCGLNLIAVTMDHMEDAESGNAAAILEWTP